jgi:hypothetical protein
MSESRNIDIETLRQSRWERVCDRTDVLFGWMRKRGWREAEAEVVECIPTRFHPSYRTGAAPLVGGYVVTFNYEVDGKRHEGTTISPDPVELHSKVTVRYNPRHPERNNSFDSETEWAEPAAKVEEVLGLCFLLFAVVVYFFVRH